MSGVHNDDTAGLSLEDFEGPFGKYYDGPASPVRRCIDVRVVLDLERETADDETRSRWLEACRLFRLGHADPAPTGE